MFAPGENVESAWIDGGANGTALLSGTSMAAPHVAGLAAYFMGVYGPHSPGEMRERIVRLSTKGRVVNAGVGSPNRIAFNGNGVEMG